ncbi:GPP34 family phosphoprotein [Mycobacterium sp. SMC-4]|uniref:GPP34 family phosphoprotein n=1 Tax=Mycobacterium sp. SMC-4 TaxID=2857059 RepID=UPI0021B22DEA|nr:GPP34 family phosphoprotein [Mycobacterium sp. SMC-4]UXA16944.1 GPP34 family phosphoprotein [Mycobacterium sp. SMC-4]
MIAEDLLLLLLDNASAQPALDQPRLDHVLAAAVLLDLAYQCRIRPAATGDPAPPGALIALAAPGPVHPVAAPALDLLRSRPLSAGPALKKVSRHARDRLVAHLEATGQIARVPLSDSRFRRSFALPLTDRTRPGAARAALLAALFERQPPAPVTAAIVTVLHAVDGLGALLSLNDRGWRWVHARAGEIAAGSWVDESPSGLAEVNLAVTAAAVRPALAGLS